MLRPWSKDAANGAHGIVDHGIVDKMPIPGIAISSLLS
jgi:hypothetical protein